MEMRKEGMNRALQYQSPPDMHVRAEAKHVCCCPSCISTFFEKTPFAAKPHAGVVVRHQMEKRRDYDLQGQSPQEGAKGLGPHLSRYLRRKGPALGNFRRVSSSSSA